MSRKHKVVTFGSDIEIFFNDEKGNSLSSQILFPEDERVEVDVGIVERDGYAVELQPRFSENPEVVRQNTGELLRILYAEMKKRNLTFSPKHIVKVDVMKLMSNGDSQALIFGCKPDLSTYTGNINTKPDANEIDARTAGGHVHLGIPEAKMQRFPFMGYDFYKPADDASEKLLASVLRWMDICVGLPSVCIDEPSNRRDIYGRAGDFRYTAFGCEYRSLSNFFLMNEELFDWVFEQSRLATQFRYTDPRTVFTPEFFTELQTCINSCNKEHASKLWSLVCAECPDITALPLPMFDGQFTWQISK